MKACTKRMLAWVLAAALLISCGISGLVLPASAEAGKVLFEENFDGTTTNAAIIKPWTDMGTIVDDPLNADNKVLKLNSAMSRTYCKALGIEPNKTYRFTFKAYGGTGIYAYPNREKGIVSNSGKTISATSGWTELTYIIMTTDQYGNFNNDAYTLGLYAPAGAYLDDFKLVEIERDTTNMVYGGDFEEVASYYADDVWYSMASVGGVVEDPDDATNHVLRFNAYGNKYYYGSFGFMPNMTYKLSFKAKGKNLGIYINKSKGFTAGGWKTVLDSTGSDKWVDYSLILTTTSAMSRSNDNRAAISFNVSNATNISGLGVPDAYIDDVRVERVPATAISLSQDPLYLAQGLTEPMELTVEPIGGKMDSLEWTSSDETIATVDANGIVTAALDKEGDVTITATAKVGETTLTASRVITVVGDASTFELAEEAMHLAPGVKKTAVVNATPKGAKVGTLTWATSDEAVATVDENGVVTAVAAGTATITVKTAEDNAIFAEEVTDSLTVTVDESGERVTGGDFETADSDVVMNGVGKIATDSANRLNKVLQLEASKAMTMGGLTLNPSKSYALTFKARGTDVTTSIAGAVAGNKGDVKTTLSATAWTKVTRTFTTAADASTVSIALKSTAAVEIDDISLVELPEATGIKVVPGGTLEMLPEGNSQVSVEAKPDGAFAGDVTYTSTNPDVVKVDAATGKLTSVADAGSAIIIATSKNEKGETMTDAITVNVTEYANVLANGDFEQGSTNWKYNSSHGLSLNEKIVDGVGVDGSKGMVLSNGTGTKLEVFYQNNVPLLPSTTYEVSFDYKTTKSGIVRLWTGSLEFGQVYSTNSEGEWKTASKVFTTSANIKYNPKYDFCIVIEDGGDDEMVVDNMCIKMYYSGVDAESIEMTRKSIQLMPGRSTGLEVAATPVNGDINGLVWTSSNENVATVEYGIVTGVGKGTATITATTKNGKSASAKVTVSGSEVMVSNGTFDKQGDKSWTVEGAAAIVDGVGVKETAGGQISKAAEGETAGKLSQTVKGLKPNTTYTLSLRYAGTGNAGILLTDGKTEFVKASETAEAIYTTKTYEFTTPAEVGENATLELTLASGNGPVTFDYILLSENATLIDLVVNDIFWTADKPLDQDHQIPTGTELLFYVAVKNQGEDPITAGMTFDVDVQVDAQTIQTITFVADEDIASGSIATAIGTEKWKATAGDHTISACANSTLSILELNDSNNDYFQTSMHVADELIPIPEGAQQAGYDELIFNDEFDNLNTIDTLGSGAAGYKWYVTRPYSNYKQTPDDYEIKDGILTVKTHNVQYNYELSTIDDTTGRGFTFNKGYLEFRMRIPSYDANAKGTPAVWSFPADKICETGSKGYAKQWVEMDWMEYWGTSGSYPSGHWTISMHETIRGYKADGITVDSETVLAQHSAENRHKSGLGDGEWHVISFLWTDDLLIGYLDGEEVHRITYAEGEFSNPLTMNAAAEDGTGAFSYMNEQMLALILGGSIDNQLEMDYIRVWSGNGAGYVPPATDDDDNGTAGGETIFDMAAADFWNNYCTDDWGDPIMPDTLDEDSVEYVLMGADLWALLSTERQAEINALLKENGQPTFEELLAAAQAFEKGEGDDVPSDSDSEDFPDTGEHASALPALMFVVMIACAVALWATRKRRVNK